MMQFSTERAGRMTTHAERLVAERQFAGIAWSVDHRGTPVARGCVGSVDADAHSPLNRDTLYRLYSMTKPVVSVLCLQLIESGRLQLDDPLSRYMPDFAAQRVLAADGSLQALERQITIEDLLTHRSGLSYDFLPGCRVADAYRDAGPAADGSRSLQDLCLELADLPLAWQPGTRWYYSYGTDVLAGVIERVLDESLGNCLQKWLFEPLGMTETGFRVGNGQQGRLSQMFGQRELGEVAAPGDGIRAGRNRLQPMDVEASYPSASDEFARGGIGLFATITDYRRFMQILMTGTAPSGQTLLSAPMLEMCWQNRLRDSQMPITIGEQRYPGYGWTLTGRVMVQPSQAMRLTAQGEGGWSGAASTWFWIDRQRQFSGLVMAQYLGSEITLGPDMQALAYAALG